MAAYSSSQSGDWSLASTWGGSGPPGNGDTATINGGNAITISGSTTVGSSPATGGTAAIRINSGTLALNSGTLTLKGDLDLFGTNTTFTMAAGTNLVVFPAASAQYQLNCHTGFAENAAIYINGSSGSRCSVTTNLSNSGSTASYISTAGSLNTGLITSTYCDWSNFGTSSTFGVVIQVDNASVSNKNVNISNCTFNACNVKMTLGTTSWDGNLTFSNNIFSNSVGNSGGIGSAGCLSYGMSNAATSGTRTIDHNSFDIFVGCTGTQSTSFNNNAVLGAFEFVGAGTYAWSAGQCQYNYFGSSISLNGLLNAYGPINNCYFGSSATDNPHFLIVSAACTIDSCVFDSYGGAPASTNGKACIFGNTGSFAVTIQRCITLPVYPSGGNYGIEILNLFGGDASITAALYHNTVANGQSYGGHFGETGTATAGQITAYKANFFYAASANANAFKLADSGHLLSGGIQDVVSPTNADYNGSFNGMLTPASSNTYTHASNGYQFNCSATPGAHDLADQDPKFVDNTRNLAAWGGTPTGGGVATAAGAIATIAANPSLIGQASTGLLAWVQAGFQPQNAALQNASYPSDPSTTDAAGNAWPGGGPGLGAMAVAPSGGGGAPSMEVLYTMLKHKSDTDAYNSRRRARMRA